MDIPHPLILKLERLVMLTADERISVHEVPFSVEEVRAGEEPSRAEDQPSGSILILEGVLSACKTTQAGGVQITAFHIPGDMPGFQSAHVTVQAYTIRALTNCVVSFMTHQDL